MEVFFVISGFLITGSILKNLQKGRFNLFDFWARRIRRIFPSSQRCLPRDGLSRIDSQSLAVYPVMGFYGVLLNYWRSFR